MFKYDPHQKSKSEIKSTFINGKKYLADILDELKPRNKNLSNQSIIIAGQRGMGKSHFLGMLAVSIGEDDLLNKHYLPVIFPEELFKAGSLYHLLKYSIDRIFFIIEKDTIPWAKKTGSLKAEYEQSLNLRFAGSKKEQTEQKINAENIFFNLLNKISAAIQKKFVFLLENLQDIFGQKLSTDELKRLRGFLQESPETLIIIGSAVSIFDKLEKYGEPFYNFFKFRRLTGLNKDEVKWFLEAEGNLRENSEISGRLNDFKGEIEVFRILTGGNPRLLLFLYDLLKENEELIIDDILRKITELTPYFKAVTENLTATKQMVIDALCESAPAQTPSEIAGYINEPIGIVIENLKRLLQEGRVRIVETERGEDIKKSETFYSVSDYFYRIWYQVRQSVSLDENLKWIAELASLLFSKPQLEEKVSVSDLKMKPVYEKALDLQQDDVFKNCINILLNKAEKVDLMEVSKKLRGLLKANDWLKIVDETKRMIERKEYLDIAYNFNGYAYQNLGQFENAIESYRKYLDINPNERAILYFIGFCFYKMHNFPIAIEYLKKIAESHEERHDSYVINREAGIDTEGDLKVYDSFGEPLEIWPENSIIYYNLGLCYYYLNQNSDAIKYFRGALEIKPDFYKAYTIGRLYVESEDWEMAIEFLTTALKLKPNEITSINNLANCYAYSGRRKEAIELYKKAIKIKPKSPQIFYSLGLTYAESKEYNKAVENFKKYFYLIMHLENLSPSILKLIKSISNKIYDKEKSIAKLTNLKLSLKKRVEAMQELLCLENVNGLETILTALFEKIEKTDREKLPQKELKELYFFLTAETILRLNNESKENLPEITGKYFIRTALLLNDDIPVEKKVLGFLVNYLNKREGPKINKDGLFSVFAAWKELNIFLPEAVTALIDALENPKSRSAQVWSSDPLFKEVLNTLSR